MRREPGLGGGQLSASSKECAKIGDAAPERPQTQGSARGSNQPAHEPRFDLSEILKSVRETAYRWDFANDRMDFAENAASVLGTGDMAARACRRAL
jgi:hypothetical protein